MDSVSPSLDLSGVNADSHRRAHVGQSFAKSESSSKSLDAAAVGDRLVPMLLGGVLAR